jgi:glycosyltransferase involved in cell wall biosynthesis
MRIGIDAHSAERDGTGNCTYTRNLIIHLTNLDTVNEYVLFVTDKNHPFYKMLQNRRNIKIVQIRRSPAWFRVFVALRKASYKHQIDLLHVQYFAPFGHRGILINTIHDAAPFRYPSYFSWFERLLFKLFLPISARKSRLILTASGASKEDLKHMLHLPDEKIRIIYCGVDQNYFSTQQTESMNSVHKRYGTNGKFLLYVGRIDPRKNLIRLIQAYNYLRTNRSIDHKLLIAGRVYLQPNELQQTLQHSEYREDIHFCGYVPDEDLPALYKAAEVLVYTSEYEGFGLPPLEAMASGTPVIASDISIFREILSDAALLVDPLDVRAIADGIYKILAEGEVKNMLCEKGKIRAGKFNWDNTAVLTLRSYQESMNI